MEVLMEQGYYGFNFQGVMGFGFGALRFESGRIAGFDFLRGQYDGTYRATTDGTYDVRISMVFPPGVSLVTGASAPTTPVILTGSLPENFWTGVPFGLKVLDKMVLLSIVKMRDLEADV
jgi:hypothetical protein